jgi:hypothetical protein
VMKEQFLRPCPTCGRPLTLVATIPRFGERPEIRVLKCTECERRDIDFLEGDAWTGGDEQDEPYRFGATCLSLLDRRRVAVGQSSQGAG